MRCFRVFPVKWVGPPVSLGLILFLAACSGKAGLDDEAIVIPERLRLRSSTAQASRVVSELKGGERVEILSRSTAEDGTPWARIKGPGGESGWTETRNLVKKELVLESQKIAEQHRGIQTQAIGRTKASLKLRLTPNRATEENVATLLPSGTEVEIIGRSRQVQPPRPASEGENTDLPVEEPSKPGPVKYDSWLLIRLKNYTVLPAGWIYGGSVELEIPPEIFYFSSSGRRIIAWQKLGTFHEEDSRSGDHFLVAEHKTYGGNDELDFDRIKILAYDPHAKNYSTPFREDIEGKLPITMKMQGTSGQFEILSLDKQNQTVKIIYTVDLLEGGIVRVSRQK